MKLYGKHTEEVAQRILDAFRDPERLPKALAPLFIRRNAPIPCRRWSWANQLVLALNGTTDARGIRQWNQAGRRIRKGATALWILAPCTKRITQTDENGLESLKSRLFGFRSVPVFVLEDTEGDPLPNRDDTCDAWIRDLPLADVAAAWDIGIAAFTHSDGDPLGYYRYGGASGQTIMLGVENLATFCHELAHAADLRLTNLAGDDACREIVAELGSAVLLECLGKSRDADLGGAYQYIQAYARRSGKDVVRACIDLLDRTCACVTLILDAAEAATRPDTASTAARA